MAGSTTRAAGPAVTLLALVALARTGDVLPAVATLGWELGALNEEFDFPNGDSVCGAPGAAAGQRRRVHLC
jgi:hypothetical protein